MGFYCWFWRENSNHLQQWFSKHQRYFFRDKIRILWLTYLMTKINLQKNCNKDTHHYLSSWLILQEWLYPVVSAANDPLPYDVTLYIDLTTQYYTVWCYFQYNRITKVFKALISWFFLQKMQHKLPCQYWYKKLL